jgi:hypothetical protein
MTLPIWAYFSNPVITARRPSQPRSNQNAKVASQHVGVFAVSFCSLIPCFLSLRYSLLKAPRSVQRLLKFYLENTEPSK